MAETELNLADIRRALAELLPELSEQYAVESLGVFGSYAHGLQKKDSDLDILVSFRQPIDFFKFIALENELSEQLGVRVDLVTREALKPRIGQRILSEVVAI